MEWHWLLIGLFFPLFPLSIGFNALLNATNAPWLKVILLLIWPQIGIALIIQHQATIPEWLQFWGLLSSGLYAFRMLAMREVNIWIGYLATIALIAKHLGKKYSGKQSPHSQMAW